MVVRYCWSGGSSLLPFAIHSVGSSSLCKTVPTWTQLTLPIVHNVHSQMARVVKVPSLHFRVFICQVFVGSSIHWCTSLNHIFDRKSCDWYLIQSFADFLSSEESCLSLEISDFIFVHQRHVHFVDIIQVNVIYPISSGIQTVQETCDLIRLWKLHSIGSFCQNCVSLISSHQKTSCNTWFDMLKAKSLALILGAYLLRPLFLLSTKLEWCSCSVQTSDAFVYFLHMFVHLHILGVFLSLVVLTSFWNICSGRFFIALHDVFAICDSLFVVVVGCWCPLALFPLSVNKCPLMKNRYTSDLHLPHSVSWAMFSKLYRPWISS